jgi:hypothetical protein
MSKVMSVPTHSAGSSTNVSLASRTRQTIFGYTWSINGLPDDDPRRTYVEFTLVPDATGTTVTVVESGFSQLEFDQHRKAFDGNTSGWASELDELVTYLHA